MSLASNKPVLLQVRDLWSGKPIAGAIIESNGLKWCVKANGLVCLDSLNVDSGTTIIVSAPSYFPETITLKDLRQNPLIYLIPLEQTTFITVVGQRSYHSPLSIPAHRTVVTFNGPLTDQELVENLSVQSGLFFKSYGAPAALQTISLRGMSAEQTQVLLDGIPLNNLQLGSMDLSLLQGGDFDALEIYRGSNALLGGSGAIGGSLNLRSRTPLKHFNLQLNSGWNSLKNKQVSLQLDLPFQQIKNAFTFSHANGLNHYKTAFESGPVLLRNRDFRQNFVAWKTVFRPQNRWRFFFRIAQFKKAAGAPKAFTNLNSEATNRARITIDNTMLYAGFRFLAPEIFEMYFNGYLRNEWMTYHDPFLLINNQSLHSVHFNQEKGLQGRFHYSPRQSLLIKSGVELAEQKISSSNAGQHGRSRASFYVLSDWRLFEKRFSLQAFHLNGGLRLEKIDRYAAIWLPSAGFTLNWSLVQFFASIGKNFRVPNFNDLFWVPGGNPELKPEYSFNSEAGLRLLKTFGQWVTQNEISIFRNVVQNQIKWLPAPNGLWQPFNIAGVKSRGLEVDWTLTDLLERFKITLNYNYIQTLKNKAEYPEDPTVGNQLPFLPREKLAVSLQLKLRNFRLTFSAQQVSFRYLDFSNKADQILPGYLESHLSLGYHFSFNRFSLQPALQIENIFNKHYAILPGYPLPGRYFALNLNFKFNQQTNGGN